MGMSMGWWSRLLDRLRGMSGGSSLDVPAPKSRPHEPSVFECQTCFKVFDAKTPGPLCPECDSPDVISLSR